MVYQVYEFHILVSVEKIIGVIEKVLKCCEVLSMSTSECSPNTRADKVDTNGTEHNIQSTMDLAPMDYSVAIDPLHGQWTILYSHSIDVP